MIWFKLWWKFWYFWIIGISVGFEIWNPFESFCLYSSSQLEKMPKYLNALCLERIVESDRPHSSKLPPLERPLAGCWIQACGPAKNPRGFWTKISGAHSTVGLQISTYMCEDSSLRRTRSAGPGLCWELLNAILGSSLHTANITTIRYRKMMPSNWIKLGLNRNKRATSACLKVWLRMFVRQPKSVVLACAACKTRSRT